MEKLICEHYWFIRKQTKALKLWDKSTKTGVKMGARSDLSRTYFEVGKSLLESNSKYKELNATTAEQYLEKDRNMFVEIGLQWDLDEFDKLIAGR